MKYNSIGEQLIAKAKELDPNYKPDKFNDMSEALDIILTNNSSGSIKNYSVSILPSEIEANSENTKWLNFKGNGLEKMSNLFSFLINNENKILKIHASFNLYASDESMYYYYNGDGSFHKMFVGEGNLVNINALRDNFLFNETLIFQNQPIINDYLEILESFTILVTYYE